METDTAKTLISFVSACVAVWGAVSALSARKQGRQDAFKDAREALHLAITESDEHAKTLAFKSDMLLSDILACLAKHPRHANAETDDLLMGLNKFVAVQDVLKGRNYSADSIERLNYSEESIDRLRAYRLTERQLHSQLQSRAFDEVFDRAKIARTELCKENQQTQIVSLHPS